MSTTTTMLFSDEGAFIETLRPGDVLLFDSARPLSGLIKFGENRPVNHSGLFLGDFMFAEATSHADGGAVRRVDLRQHLSSRRQRTATAFRHKGAQDRTDVAPILDRAEHYIESGEPYAYRSLYRLIVPSLLRSYGGESSGAQGSSTRTKRYIGALAMAIADSSLALWDQEGIGTAEQSGTNGLTCSEFVYRCYSEASDVRSEQRLSIEVLEPLVCVTGRRRPGSETQPSTNDDRVTTRSGAFDFADVPFDQPDEPGFSFHDNLAGDFDADLGPVTRGLGFDAARDIARIAKGALVSAIKQQLLHRPQQTADRRQVVPDTVTPRDLWSSPSLAAVSVFHRPPSPEDDYFEFKDEELVAEVGFAPLGG